MIFCSYFTVLYCTHGTCTANEPTSMRHTKIERQSESALHARKLIMHIFSQRIRFVHLVKTNPHKIILLRVWRFITYFYITVSIVSKAYSTFELYYTKYKMKTKVITTLALLPLVSGHTGLRAKQRQAQACDCDPYNYKYDLECCGPACAFPDSQFYDVALCSCDSCDVKGACFDIEHCCDPCIKESRCFSEEQCCDPCDPRSYCFDFYADCDIHYGTNKSSLKVTSVTVSNATKAEAAAVANATTVEATAVGELEATPLETAQPNDKGHQ